MNYEAAEIKKDAREAYSQLPTDLSAPRPNIVFVLADDMGYGDISCYGATAIHTPNIDAIAQQGLRFTNAYASSPVCSPSRYSILTGRYPIRGHLAHVFFPTVTETGREKNRSLFRYGINGILPDEISLAYALKSADYHTAIFGKWHLGDCSPHLPTENGFEYFYGSYYSNDMQPYEIYRNEEIDIPEEVDQDTLTARISGEICDYIENNRDKPFFVYYASPFPHHPVHASEKFFGRSKAGTYGDCVEELDWSVGQIRSKLEELGLLDNTVFIFTSDNGPWYEGNPGYHRGRKRNCFDGGQIVPLLMSWPERLPAGRSVETMTMNVDFYPTLLKLAGAALPEDRIIDGKDMAPLLSEEEPEDIHSELLYIIGYEVLAIRDRDGFKYHKRYQSENSSYSAAKQGPFLFDLNVDPNESYNAISHYPEKAKELAEKLELAQRLFDEDPRGWRKADEK